MFLVTFIYPNGTIGSSITPPPIGLVDTTGLLVDSGAGLVLPPLPFPPPGPPPWSPPPGLGEGVIGVPVVESGVDSGIDSGVDSGVDSGIESGIDSGVDAGELVVEELSLPLSSTLPTRSQDISKTRHSKSTIIKFFFILNIHRLVQFIYYDYYIIIF